MTIEMEDLQIRQRFDIAYTELRTQFIKISKNHLGDRELNLLKTKYYEVINSTRVFDLIKDIEGLLRTLEKRGKLSYNNIEILKYISETYVKDRELERLLINYEGQPRPSLQPHNRYLALSGKYTMNKLTTMISNATASNENVIPDVNLTENRNECFNRLLEEPARYRTSSEDLTIAVATEILIPNNNVPTLHTGRRNVANDRIYFVKVREKICSKYCLGLMGAFLGTILLILSICMSNFASVESPASAPSFDALPSTSGAETIFNNASHMPRQPILVTLYTTQPAFRITLPGSLEIGSAKETSKSNEAELMTRVLQELSENLGRHWRNVARHLRVTEHDIDEIDQQSNLSLSEKALKALLKFQKKTDPLQWKAKLRYALNESRRRDLMELVDELLSRKY